MKDFVFPCLPEMPGRRLIDHIRDPVTDLLTGRGPGEFRGLDLFLPESLDVLANPVHLGLVEQEGGR